MKPPNYILNSPWDAKEKQLARIVSIIELYRYLFNRKSIPEHTQYWSLCGSHTKGGQPIKGELGQLIESGLIQPTQYFGVDREKIIIDNNKNYYPNINWIHNDFINAMKEAVTNNTFNPSIINYDGVMQPQNSIEYLKRILTLLDYNISKKVMLISNFILHNPYTTSEKLKFSIHETLDKLGESYWFPDHWNLYHESYEYSHSQAKMGLMIFIKEPHDINNIRYTPNRRLGNIA